MEALLSSPGVVLFLFGGVLLATGLLGGGLEISLLKIPKVEGRSRMLTGTAGMAFTLLGLLVLLGDLPDRADQPPSTATPGGAVAAATAAQPVSPSPTPQPTLQPPTATPPPATTIPAQAPTPPAATTPTRAPTPAATTIPTVAPTPTPVVGSCRVVTQGLNVRSGPGIQFPLVQVLTRDDDLTALGRYPDDHWIRVQLPATDLRGWVSTVNAGAATVSCDIDLATLSPMRP